MNPRLGYLLETDEFDWENDKHREVLLRTWVERGGQELTDFSRKTALSQEKPVD